MAAKYRFKVKGIPVEMWETSFRVKGMGLTMYVGHHMTKDMVERMVEAVYESVYDKAHREAVDKVADDFAKHIREKVLS